MCSFLFTNKKIIDLTTVNLFQQKRGPDCTNEVCIDNFSYVHNLLSITGDFTPQPLIDNGIVLLYNGEIYNYKNFGDYKSDGISILELYKKEGLSSFHLLDGEFAICLHDKEKNEIILCSDTFGTKPMYYSIEDNYLGVSSYPSALELLNFKNIKRFEPNKIKILNDKDLKIKKEINLYNFDTKQNVSSFEPWIESFSKSVEKRVNTSLEVLVPLSSGYDSGAICCALNNLNKDYISYTIIGKENKTTIDDRLKINKNSKKELIFNLSHDKIQTIQQEFIQNVQPFGYGPNPQNIIYNGFDDPGSIGLFFILKEMKEKYNIKIVISGHGSDEIMTNIQEYGFKTKNPSFFPVNLSDVFPWENFYYGSQWSYLMKEECIAGSLGIETRYPFLDRNLVQNYLNLTPELKMLNYKSPLHQFFTEKDYPFFKGKIGFQIT